MRFIEVIAQAEDLTDKKLTVLSKQKEKILVKRLKENGIKVSRCTIRLDHSLVELIITKKLYVYYLIDIDYDYRLLKVRKSIITIPELRKDQNELVKEIIRIVFTEESVGE